MHDFPENEFFMKRMQSELAGGFSERENPTTSGGDVCLTPRLLQTTR
jgi:hypothetical protein